MTSGYEEELDDLKEWARKLDQRRLLEDLMDIRELKDRFNNGCRMCGIKRQRAFVDFGWAQIVSRNSGQLEPLSPGASVCDKCLLRMMGDVLRESPFLFNDLKRDWVSKQIAQAEGRAEKAEEKLANFKEARRKSDSRRKEARKKHDETKRNQPKPISYFVDQGDWGKLRVIFSEDSVGLGLIALISHPTTPEAERDNAITKLKGRRVKWQQQRTTSAGTQNTRRETKSALSLASSRGE